MTFAVDALLHHLRKLSPKRRAALCGPDAESETAPTPTSVISDERYGFSVDCVLEGAPELAKRLVGVFHTARTNPPSKSAADAVAREVEEVSSLIIRGTCDNEGASCESEMLAGALKRVSYMVLAWLGETENVPDYFGLFTDEKAQKVVEPYMAQHKARLVDQRIDELSAAVARIACHRVLLDARARDKAAAQAAEQAAAQARFVDLYIGRRSATIARSACERVLAEARARDEVLAAKAARVRRLNVEAGELALRRTEDAARRRRAQAKEEKAAEQAAKLEKKKERARLEAEQKAAAAAAAEAARERKKAAFQREKARRKQEHEAVQREAEAAAARERERRAAERKAAAAARREAEAEARQREAEEQRRRQEEAAAQRAHFEKRYSHELPQWRKKRDRARCKESPDYDAWLNAVLEGEKGNWQDAASCAQAAHAMHTEWQKKLQRKREEELREADEAAQAILAVQKAEEEEEAARAARVQAVWEAGKRADEERKAEEAKRKAEFAAEAKRKLAEKQAVEVERTRLKKEASVAAAQVRCKSQAERVHEAQRKVDVLHARFKAAEGSYLQHRTALQHAWTMIQQASAAGAPPHVIASLTEKHRCISLHGPALSDARRSTQREYDYECHLLRKEKNMHDKHGDLPMYVEEACAEFAANRKFQVLATTKQTPLPLPPPPSPSSKAEDKKPLPPPPPPPPKPRAEECAVCFTEYGEECRKHALAPCGHQLCGECAHLVEACPTCKQPIAMRLPLF